MIRVEYTTRLVSVLNARENHFAKARRVKRERANAQLMLRSAEVKTPKPALPVEIVVTRIAPRALDTHDNLGASAKGTVDQVCDWLGIKDNDPRVRITVAQEKAAKPRHYAVRIEIWEQA
jgi:hypothetical protein